MCPVSCAGDLGEKHWAARHSAEISCNGSRSGSVSTQAMGNTGTAAGLEPACSEKEKLHHAYRVANSDYTRAFALLNRMAGVLPQEKYSPIREFVVETRLRCRDIRRQLDRHIAEHGC